MSVCQLRSVAAVVFSATVVVALSLGAASPLASQQPKTPDGGSLPGRDTGAAPACLPASLGSPFIPVDNWVYPAILRLYSLGYIDNVFLGMRPWTRASVGRMIDEAGARIEDADESPAKDEAEGLYEALLHELSNDTQGPCLAHRGNSRIESVYTVARNISGTPLRDSYHLGSTVVNDYGRPFESGFNSYTGASGYAAAGRFLLYVRGEFQAAPSATGYSSALAQQLSAIDGVPYLNPATGLPYSQATIPLGPIATTTTGRVLEAYASVHVLSHELAFGKQDSWLGPGVGGAMAYSNNAENIYSFRINRTEPLHVPLLSRITGPFRYDFIIGSLRGHNYMPNPANPGGTDPLKLNVINPGDPWVHVEKISFRPTENLEFGFERTAIWAGKGHGPITLHTFLKSFFSFSSPVTTSTSCTKCGRDDPGARFGAFDFSYRPPLVRNWITLYADSEVHDDVSPIDAPRRASWRPGIYLSHVPGFAKLDLRVEGVTTDPPVTNSNGGRFMYFEAVQRQGYTNQGSIFGDWMGREGKGGQGWLTYHLSGNEWIQASARNQKVAKDFVPGGTTLNDFSIQVVKRLGRDFEVNGNFAYERWKAPVYLTGEQTVTTTTIQLTWFPERKVSF